MDDVVEARLAADRARQAQTGKVLWDRVAHEGMPKTKRHPKSSQASATPVTDGTHVIVSFGSEGLYAYDVNGKLLWKQDLGVLNAGWFYDPDYEWGVGSSPIIWKNLVIVQCDIQKNSFIAAFDVATGKPVWRTSREEIPSWSTPTIFEANGRAELVTQAHERSRAATTRPPARSCGGCPATPRSRFRRRSSARTWSSSPTATAACSRSSRSSRARRGDITLKAGETTERVHRLEHEARRARTSRRRSSTAISSTCCRTTASLAAYDVEDRRSASTRSGSAARGGSFSASPVAADGKIYLSSEDGDVFVVKAGPAYELLATNPVGEVLMATPAISDGVLIIRGVKHVIAIGQKP